MTIVLALGCTADHQGHGLRAGQLLLFPMILGALAWGCGAGDAAPESTPPAAFSLSVEPEAVSVPQGSRASFTAKLTRDSGFDADVEIALEDPPDGIGGDVLTMPAIFAEATVRVEAAVSLEPATHSIRVVASSKGQTATANLELDVVPAEPSSQGLINVGLESGAIDYPTSLLYRAYALFDVNALPEEYRGDPGAEIEDDGLFVEAVSPDLPEEVKTALLPFLARPNDPLSGFSVSTGTLNPTVAPGNFRFLAEDPPAPATCEPAHDDQIVQNGWKSEHGTAPVRVWVQCTENETADNLVLRTALRFADELWEPMTELMGPPIADDPSEVFNVDDAIDIYIVPGGGTVPRISQYKLTAKGAAPSAPPTQGSASSGFIMIRRGEAFSQTFESTLAHEFFHVLQKAHNASFQFASVANGRPSVEYWFVEASATWAQSHFVRLLAPHTAYVWFSELFQRSNKSLHRSYPNSSLKTNAPNDVLMEVADSKNMYAAFIWPFFAEQELAPAIVKNAWEALRQSGSHDQANQALDGVFDFTTNFREFAIRNLNSNFPGVLDDGNRYQALDSHFPSTTPQQIVVEPLSEPDTRAAPVEIAPLRAHYYNYHVMGDIRQIVFKFDGINPREGLDIDGLVRLADAGKNWKREDYTGRTEVRFCRDKPEEELAEIMLVLSNRNLPLEQFVLGTLVVEASEAPCDQVPSSYSYTIDVNSSCTGHMNQIADATNSIQLHCSGTQGVALEYRATSDSYTLQELDAGASNCTFRDAKTYDSLSRGCPQYDTTITAQGDGTGMEVSLSRVEVTETQYTLTFREGSVSLPTTVIQVVEECGEPSETTTTTREGGWDGAVWENGRIVVTRDLDPAEPNLLAGSASVQVPRAWAEKPYPLCYLRDLASFLAFEDLGMGSVTAEGTIMVSMTWSLNR